VDDKFRTLIPIYLELDEGKMVFLGGAHIIGNTPVAQKVPLKDVVASPN
jgi:hypothetical protein